MSNWRSVALQEWTSGAVSLPDKHVSEKILASWSSSVAKVEFDGGQWQNTHPSSVVQNSRVWPAVVGRVGVWVVAEPRQHGGDDGHVS